ncbi:MAG: hypothetical protein FWC16_04295 [Defluviitaleaceae bacterium]|nr:hypothetical protein [Defluviitaleaceae bacterium]MCL2274127.1 hypothetical protein [Defluviitaleaceae bacterium]
MSKMITLTAKMMSNLNSIVEQEGGKKGLKVLLKCAPVTVTRIFKNKEISRRFLTIIENKYGELESSEPVGMIGNIFDDDYNAYYFGVNHKNIIHESKIYIQQNGKIRFVHLEPKKECFGVIYLDHGFINIILEGKDPTNVYHSYIMMPRPRLLGRRKYRGGIGLYMVPGSSDIKPSIKKIILSNIELDHKAGQPDYKTLHDHLLLVEEVKIDDVIAVKAVNVLEVSNDDSSISEYIKYKNTK